MHHGTRNLAEQPFFCFGCSSPTVVCFCGLRNEKKKRMHRDSHFCITVLTDHQGSAGHGKQTEGCSVAWSFAANSACAFSCHFCAFAQVN